MFGLIKDIFIGLLIGLVNGYNQKNMHPSQIKNVQLNLLLLIYILMNKLKDYLTIHLRLI